MTSPFRTQGINEVRLELEKLLDAGRRNEMLDVISRLLQATAAENDRLALANKELLNRLYGRKSERISEDQLRFLFEELCPPSSDGQPPAEKPVFEPEEPAVSEPPSSGESRNQQKRRGHKSLPEHLPREEVRIAPTAEQLEQTSGGMRIFQEEVSEVLEYEPGRFKVIRYIREVWSNSVGEIVRAPAPAKVIDKGLPGPNLLAHVLVSKYRDHCPLNRQVSIYRRAGVELSRNTLVDWIAAAAFLLQPLARLIYSLVMVAHVLQVDDSKLPVQDRRKAKNIKRGHLWALVGDHYYVAYRYTANWTAKAAFGLLGKRVGWMQVDGYKGYVRIFALGHALEVGCFMHMRRYFVRALENKDLRAVIPVERIRAIYKVERSAKDAGDTPEERLQRRERDSLPLVLSLRAWLDEQIGRHPPKSPLGRAVTYADNHWDALCRPWQDGTLEIDNGDVERALRGNAVGRKNWLFAGSDEGAERAAIIHTVVESAARHGLDVEAYLRDVLMKIASGWPNKRLGELLPHCWHEPGHAEPVPDSVDAIRAFDDSS